LQRWHGVQYLPQFSVIRLDAWDGATACGEA
jgi:hypothetical protein